MVWPTVELGDVTREIDRSEAVRPESTYRLLGMRSKIGGPFLRETKLGTETSATRLSRVKTGDFIYSRLFAWQGSFGVIPENLEGCYVSNEFPLFEVDEERLDSRFLTFWFGLRSTQRAVETDCYGSTPGTRNRFKETYFKKLRVPLPPLSEQRRIVARLDRVASLVDERRQVLAEAVKDTDVLLHKAFQHVVAGADYLPMERAAPLIRRPVDVQPDESYPELGVRSFGRGTFHKPALEGTQVGSKKLFLIEPGDLVFNIVFAWEGAVAIAKQEDSARAGSHRFLTCVPDPTIASADFLLYYFLTREGIDKLGEASPGGAGRNRTLGLKKLAAIDVPVPPIERQRWFDDLQGKVRELRRTRADTAIDLDALLPAMLHEVFGGVIPKPEPQASDTTDVVTLRAAAG